MMPWTMAAMLCQPSIFYIPFAHACLSCRVFMVACSEPWFRAFPRHETVGVPCIMSMSSSDSFSLGSYFTPPALGQLGLVFCRKTSARTCTSSVLILALGQHKPNSMTVRLVLEAMLRRALEESAREAGEDCYEATFAALCWHCHVE